MNGKWIIALTAVGAFTATAGAVSPAAAAQQGTLDLFNAVPAPVVRTLAPELPVTQTTTDPITGSSSTVTVGSKPVSGLLDIYDGKKLIANNVKPGAFKSLKLSVGAHTINVYADGYEPGTGTTLISIRDVKVNTGPTPTLALRLNRTGTKMSSQTFANAPAVSPGGGNGWLVVRNLAATGPLDVTVNSKQLFADLANGRQAVSALPANQYTVAFRGGPGKKKVLAKATGVKVAPTKAAIVYVWGSAAAGVVKASVQTTTIN